MFCSATLCARRLHQSVFLAMLFAAIGAARLDAAAPAPDPNAVDDNRHAPLSTTAESDYKPTIHAASNEAERQIATFQLPAGFKAKLWAAEPMLANPVCITVDEHGRVFVGETYRIKHGVDDDRGHMDWLDDDMASTTVADRLALYKKHLRPGQEKDYTSQHDRIRLLEDRSGGGVADHATTYCDDFHDLLDGIGAGLLAHHGDLYYADIPHLWLLRDTKQTGHADFRQSLQYGYGVRVSFLGHDLHGLKIGPDGKLYFSIGDRAYHVVTNDGRTVADANSGAVLRCNLDGSGLDVFATGLRNPQRLTFDEYGNLFTCDNNSDSGDRARWVYIVEGSDNGWRMPYQYLNDRGPFNREHLWDPQFEGQAAYIVPPVGWIADGPSGLVYYPGCGFADAWQGHFFLCDFRGGASASGVHSLAVKPKGASFEITDAREFFWHVLTTDLEWSLDGGLYVTDWVEGWNGAGKGRIYRVSDPAHEHDAAVEDVKRLLGEGMKGRSLDELIKLLGHVDMRVRQEAQFALTDQGNAAIASLSNAVQHAAASDEHQSQLSRIHAIWAIGQIAAQNSAGKQTLKTLSVVRTAVTDPDAEIRAQAARVLGDAHDAESFNSLLGLLRDPSLRVRHLAAIAVGKFTRVEAVPAILQLLRDNNNADAVLRHSAVMALYGSAGRTWNGIPLLLKAMNDKSPAVRLGVLLALRRGQQPLIESFLKDSDPLIVLEAARAINDVPLDQCLPALAALADQPAKGSAIDRDALTRRVINANFRLGKPENAAAVARLAAKAGLPDDLRIEALKALGDWAKPSGHDRVTNFWRPLPARPANIAADALRPVLLDVFASASDQVGQAASQVAGSIGFPEVAPELAKMVADRQRSPETRGLALHDLAKLKAKELDAVLGAAMQDQEPVLRAEARRVLAEYHPAQAYEPLAKALADGQLVERQQALAALALLKNTQGDALLADWLDKLLAGAVPPELQLDLLDAAGKRDAAELRKRLTRYNANRPNRESIDPYRESLAGGNAERGRKIFFESIETQCSRCHTIGGKGGRVGPDLSKISGQKPREYLLESIVDPNKVIAKGFETALLTLDDGRQLAGIVKSETAKQLELITPEGKSVVVLKSSIDERTVGKSAMPQDISKTLTKFDLRDVVEFLAEQK